MSLLAAALDYAAAGWRVFPLRPGEKRPATENGFHNASDDPNDIGAWWRRWPSANIGLVIPAGVVLVDLDPRNGSEHTVADLVERHGPLPSTLTQHTAGGGMHLFYAHPGGDLRASAGAGIDVKAKGYAVAAPSTIGGRSYRWVEPDAPVAPMPEWLAALVRQPLRPIPHVPRFAKVDGDRPGDAFNLSTTWEQILEPAGWQRTGHRGEVTYWRRPNKRRPGVSATTTDHTLYVFSTEAHPLEPGRPYDRFGAFACLYHGGSFPAAARALRDAG